jgi:transcription-repair coupling factor (superfamily II helicase)
MFIAHAEQFGLAQLYQLRGRVGRSEAARALLPDGQALERCQPEARRRLEAVQRHSELGSGFGVAVHDLEIRGAGELLGARQSGQIQAIGFDAYARILQEAVAELRGEPILRETDPEMVFDAPAYLPEAYVGGRPAPRLLSPAVGGPRSRPGRGGDGRADRPLRRAAARGAVELRGERLSVRLGSDTAFPTEVAAKLATSTKGRMRLAGPDRIVVRVEGGGEELRLRRAVDALVELCAALPAGM